MVCACLMDDLGWGAGKNVSWTREGDMCLMNELGWSVHV